MSDEEETADQPIKTSKRDRLKGALSRTKTKLKKKEVADGDADYKPVHDDVEDFLAQGRNSTSTGRPSISESFVLGRPSTSDSLIFHTPAETLHDPFAQPQPSPRRIVVPKIDVSSSQRWPAAKRVEVQQGGHGLLRPEYQARSQSVSSLSKGRGRARGMSVSFTTKPPTVIGEGGDEAQAPPIEISKARARSVSPVPTPRTTDTNMGPWGSRSPGSRKPLPNVANLDQTPCDLTASLGLTRVQTGISTSPAPGEAKTALEKEFEMSLGLTPSSTNSAGSNPRSMEPPHIVSPKPIHPPAPYPSLKNVPAMHELKSTSGTVNLRNKFDGHERQANQEQVTSAPWQPPRYYEQRQQPSQSSPPEYEPPRYYDQDQAPSRSSPPKAQTSEQYQRPPAEPRGRLQKPRPAQSIQAAGSNTDQNNGGWI